MMPPKGSDRERLWKCGDVGTLGWVGNVSCLACITKWKYDSSNANLSLECPRFVVFIRTRRDTICTAFKQARQKHTMIGLRIQPQPP